MTPEALFTAALQLEAGWKVTECRFEGEPRRHWSGVVAFLKARLTNGAIEAINGLLQLAKRLARGFRSLRYFRIMAYLKAAGLHLDLPSPVAHSK